MGQYIFKTLLDTVIASITGGCAGVAGYRRLGFQFKAAAISSGSGLFKVQGTVNGADWTYLNTLIDNVTNTNSQNLTRVASKNLTANGQSLMWLDEGLSLRAIRISLTRTTDGSYSCYLLASE